MSSLLSDQNKHAFEKVINTFFIIILITFSVYVMATLHSRLRKINTDDGLVTWSPQPRRLESVTVYFPNFFAFLKIKFQSDNNAY